jgi:hypothetical protein
VLLLTMVVCSYILPLVCGWPSLGLEIGSGELDGGGQEKL